MFCHHSHSQSRAQSDYATQIREFMCPHRYFREAILQEVNSKMILLT